MKRIVLTGPTGALGMALINKCIEENVEVLAICRKDSKRAERIPKHRLVRKVFCDLNQLSLFKYEEDEKYDVFYHFAWEGTTGKERENLGLQLKNVEYALDAVALAKNLGCHTFIGAGSQAEYGRVEGKISPHTPTYPETGYGIAKLCAGQMTKKACEEIQMRYNWVRILSVYGPYDGGQTMVMSLLSNLKNHGSVKTTKGEQVWDYLYSEDAAEAFYLIGESGEDKKVYVLGSGKPRQLKDFIYDIRSVAAPNAIIETGAIPYANKQVMHLEADISELNADTGWRPKTEFKEGIQKIINTGQDR